MRNKKIIFSVTRKYMLANKKRTVTTLFGMILMVVLLTCVFVGKDTVFAYLTSVSAMKSGNWHVILYDADSRQYDKVKRLDYIAKTAVSHDLGFAECSGNHGKPFWEIKGYSSENFEWMNISLQEGRYPENDSEIIISRNAVEDGVDIKIGDALKADFFERYIKGVNPEVKQTVFPFDHITVNFGETVKVGQEFPYYETQDSIEEIHKKTGVQKGYRVVGIMEAPSYEGEDSCFYAALTYSKNQLVKGETGNISCRFRLDQMPSEYGYLTDLSQIMGNRPEAIDYNDIVLVFSESSSDSSLNLLVHIVMCFFAGLIILISMILIYNVFQISYEERVRYLGFLSSVGATSTQRKSSVYYEALFLLLLALPAGFLLGLGSICVGLRILNPYLIRMLESVEGGEIANHVSASLCIHAKNIVLIFLIAAATILLSVYLPARKVGKQSPLDSVREIGDWRKKTPKTSRLLWERRSAVFGLAIKNVRFQNAKTHSVVRSIAVFIMILTITAFGASAVTKMVHYRLVEDVSAKENITGYDYAIHEMSGFGSDYYSLKEELESSKEVAETKEWYTGMFVFQADRSVFSEEYWEKYRLIANEYFEDPFTAESFQAYMPEKMPVSIYAFDDETFGEIAARSGADMDIIQDEDADGFLFYQNLELSTENLGFENKKARAYKFYELENATSLSIGEQLQAELYNVKTDKIETVPCTLAGYATKDSIKDFLTFHGEQAWILTRNSTARKMNKILMGEALEDRDGNYNTMTRELFVNLIDKNGQMSRKLKNASLDTSEDQTYIVASGEDPFSLSTITETINFMIDIVAVCFVLFASFICLLNLFNSVRGMAEMRRKELAMLRTIGITQNQLRKMLLVENSCLFFKGIFWAVLLASPVMAVMKKFLMDYFGHMEMEVPVFLYVIGSTIAAGSLLVISNYCYRYKTQSNLLEDLRNENV